MFTWNGNLHKPLLHNSERASGGAGPERDGEAPPAPQFAFSITRQRLLSLRMSPSFSTKMWTLRIQTTQLLLKKIQKGKTH